VAAVVAAVGAVVVTGAAYTIEGDRLTHTRSDRSLTFRAAG